MTTLPEPSAVRHLLRTLLLGLCLLLPIGAAAAEGIGGTGKPIAGSEGIGGTGSPVARDEASGIGGTGAPRTAEGGSGIGGTGIVGVITGFGSIWVNGVEVHYGTDAVIHTPGGPRSTDSLAIGQFVLVASERAGEQTIARHIGILPAVAGPVTASDEDSGRITVAGQPVILQGLDRAWARVGTWVAISGLRRADGTIVATGVSPYAADRPVLVYGRLQDLGADGRGRVQSLPVALPPGSALPTEGTLLLSGRLRNGVLYVEQVSNNPVAALAQASDAISIQGFVQQRSDATLTVSELSIRLAAGARLPSLPAIDQLVQIQAHRSPVGEFIADRIDSLSLHDLQHTATEVLDGRARMRPARREGLLPPTRSPSREGHAFDRHRIDRPEFERPEFESPETEVPEVEIPEVEVPEVEVPEVEVPEIEVPEMEVPEVEVPEIEVPEFERPEFERPEFERPEFERPEFEFSR